MAEIRSTQMVELQDAVVALGEAHEAMADALMQLESLVALAPVSGSLTDNLIDRLGAVDVRYALPIREVEAGYLRRTPAEMRDVKWIVVHHTGAGVSRPRAEAIARYQTGPGPLDKFPAIAYHVVIEADGTIYWCHDLETVVWSNGVGSPTQKQGVGVFNWQSFAVCFSGENPTAIQTEVGNKVILTINEAMNERLSLRGHGDLSRTQCPGPTMTEWVKRHLSIPPAA